MSGAIGSGIGDWRMAVCPAGSVDRDSIDRLPLWYPAPVPGTALQALCDNGAADRSAPPNLHDKDVWYRAPVEGVGMRTLRFEGLATLAQVWLGARPILAADNMFRAYAAEVELSGPTELVICFRALTSELQKRLPRARWRTKLAQPPGLRGVRTTLLGHMPGWCPPAHAVGPWRPISLESAADVTRHIQLSARLDEDGTGSLLVCVDPRPVAGSSRRGRSFVSCAGHRAEMAQGPDGLLRATLAIPGVAPWWPHTHGEPTLHNVELDFQGTIVPAGRAGFRRIHVDRGSDGRDFSLVVNGRPVFCRGAAWTSPDVMALPCTRDAYAPWLQLARDGGMNMLRVSGITVYEADPFYELCDELGLLVWQDFMFANFDYPVTDTTFAASVREEARHFLMRTAACPSLAVLCGGSEVSQQAAMLGLPPSSWSSPLFDEILPGAVAQIRPDVVYVPNSPSGGHLPFCVNHGVGHYYGVGAYLRPLDDARRAHVRFASECLAFANVPEPSTLEAALPVPPVHHPLWKAATPRDPGVSWDFEDVRDHYLEALLGVDPVRLRRENVEFYLEASRWVTGAVMERVFGEWRRNGSTTGGGLVWQFQDLVAGAGWGVIDALGEPKAAWYALRRAFATEWLGFTDEGVNGLALHVCSDRSALEGTLTLSFLSDGADVAVSGSLPVSLSPGEKRSYTTTDFTRVFYDSSCSYLFGEPVHDVAVAHLRTSDGRVLAQATHVPRPPLVKSEIGLRASVADQGETMMLTVQAERFAQGLHILAPGWRAEDNWFDLPPGIARKLRLSRIASAEEPPLMGTVTAINARRPASFGAP